MYRYQGMDGIKTGYTNASGFNVVSAVQDGNRRVVGVVLGGRTARSRDDKMAALLDKYLGRTSSGGSTRCGRRCQAAGRGCLGRRHGCFSSGRRACCHRAA